MAIALRVLRGVIFSLISVGAIFAVLATAGNYWLQGETFHAGLWKLCGANQCSQNDKNDSLRATQVLMILSCLCYAFGFAYVALIHFIPKDLSVRFLATIVFVTCVLEVAGLSVFTANNRESSELHYGWSYALGWCSSILTLIAGMLCFADNGYIQLD